MVLPTSFRRISDEPKDEQPKGERMKRKLIAASTMALAGILLCAAVLAGCASQPNGGNTEQQANRAYMSQVNQIMDEATGQLDAFVEAVSGGDLVNMRTQANNASRTLAKISQLEAPDALKDIQQSYSDGVSKLQEALDGYIDLYAQVESGSFDSAAFEEQRNQIQSLYDEGVAALQKGDEDAAAL